MPVESGSRCPSDATLVRFSDGRLVRSRRAEVERHLDSCEACREVVAAAAGKDTVFGTGDSVRTDDAAGARPSVETPQLGETIGRYRLTQLLGQGAMGLVFAAHDPELDRIVALKIVKAAVQAPQSRRERMIREAQALASMSHPNVVPIFDVGECSSGVFIVMELIDGDDLRFWCRDRPWRDVVRCFIDAGLGLAAAHAAGITHRDFKPSNVLVGTDGRVRVTDFGLAGTLGEATSRTSGGSDGAGTPPWRLTQTGEVMGTPAYMSPEQFHGRPVTAASDQFSFCVALAEAVGGRRPTQGRSFLDLATSAETASTRVTFDDTEAPEALAGLVRRGLSREPERRFPSMPALIRALEAIESRTDPNRRRTIWLVGGLAVVGIGGAVALGPTDDHCKQTVADLSPEFGDARRAALEQRIGSASKQYGDQTAERVGLRLSEFVEEWTQARLSVCEAATSSSDEGRQLDRAVRCLQRQRDDFDAAVAVLGEDETPVEQAVGVVADLGAPSTCLDAEHLASQQGAPDPSIRAEVRRLEAVMSNIRALFRAFRFSDVNEHLDREQALFDSVDWPPIRIEAMYYRASSDGMLGDRQAEREGLTRAYELASETGYDRFAFRAAAALMLNTAFSFGDFEASDRWSRAAEAIANRSGSRGLRAKMLRTRAQVSVRRSRFEDAHDQAKEALQLYLGNPERSRENEIALIQGTLGKIALYQRDFDEAKQAFEAQLKGYEAVYGSKHPRCTEPLLGLVQVAQAERNWDAAAELLDRREAIVRDVFGPDSVRRAHNLELRSNIEEARGNLEEALASAEAALTVVERSEGKSHPTVGSRHSRVGMLLMRLGRYTEAHEHHLEASEFCERFAEPTAVCVLTSQHNLGESLSALERFDEAIDAYERALAVATSLYGLDHGKRAYPLTGLGEVHLERGEYEQARARLRESVKLSSTAPINHSEWAEAAFSLARALAEEPEADDAARREAVELADEAIAQFTESGGYDDELAEVRRWLAAHR